METSTKTNEAVNALSSLVAQRVKNICDTASMGGFSQLQDINPIDVTRLLSYQINVLTTAPTLKAASESAVRSNLLLSYNSLTQESTTLEALDDSSQAQLLVGAAQTSTQRKTAAWKFFEAAGFGVPTIESLSLTGHGGRTTAMPLIPESVINSAEAFLANNYKWNLAGILYALNRVASWEIHYTETSNPGSAAHQALLLPAIMASGGGSIIQSGLLDSNSYTVIGANNAPTIEAGSFATMLYGTIPSYEGYCTLIRNTERPNSPTWEIPSIISVVTLAFPASFWDTTPNDPSDARVFDASTQLNVLQSYALIYFRVLKCQGLNTTPPAPYFNHALWIQYDSRPNIETELMQYLYESKL
jgi:hypothetical protein